MNDVSYANGESGSLRLGNAEYSSVRVAHLSPAVTLAPRAHSWCLIDVDTPFASHLGPRPVVALLLRFKSESE